MPTGEIPWSVKEQDGSVGGGECESELEHGQQECTEVPVSLMKEICMKNIYMHEFNKFAQSPKFKLLCVCVCVFIYIYIHTYIYIYMF